MSEYDLEQLGWTHELHQEFAQLGSDREVPVRVVAPDRGYVDVLGTDGPARAMLTGPARFDPPTVGDWVCMVAGDPPTVRERLTRRSELRRKSAGGTSRSQCIAANVDVVFVVTDHDKDFNLRRIERYVTAVQDGGARPVVVLNKSDEVSDPSARTEEVESTFAAVPVLSVSALDSDSTASLIRELDSGTTSVLVGSSGVGKSTLTNALTGVTQATGAVDEVGKGRHTTTVRQMFRVQGDSWLIDTPGMREFGLVDVDQESVDQTFEDILALAAQCRFGNCRHAREPGCAVRGAIEAGELVAERLRSYEKLQGEVAYENSRANESGRHELKQKGKEFARKYRKANQQKAKRRGES